MEPNDPAAIGSDASLEADLSALSVLLFVGDGATESEISDRVQAFAARLGDAGAARPLERLAGRGLVRIASPGGVERRYVRTALGEELARSASGMNPRLQVGLEELERLRTQLVATIAHELRTPLTAMRTCIGLMLDSSGAAEPSIRERLLNTIASSADKMQKLIADLLDLAQYRSGSIDLQSWWVDASELAGDATRLVAPLYEARNQRLDVQYPDTPLLVFGDRRRLEQALLNLLANANRFSPDGETVRLVVRGDGPDVLWEVRDRGPGIALADQRHLFERFFRSSSDTAGGAGLGLPIALAIAQAHEGTIEVDSTPGDGSCFTLRVPHGGSTSREA